MELRLKRMQYEVAFFVDADKVQQMSLSYGPHWVMLQEVAPWTSIIMPFKLSRHHSERSG